MVSKPDVAPEELLIHDEGAVQLTHGHEFNNEPLEWVSSWCHECSQSLCLHWSVHGRPLRAIDSFFSCAFQRNLDAALEILKEDHGFYTCETPVMGREEHDSVQDGMPVSLHESFHHEVVEHPESVKSWSRKIESEAWVEAYERHSLFRSSSRRLRMRWLVRSVQIRFMEPCVSCKTLASRHEGPPSFPSDDQRKRHHRTLKCHH